MPKFITKNGKKIPIGNRKGALPKTKLNFDEESNLSAKEFFIERGMPSNVAEAQNARNSTRGTGKALDPPEIILRDRKLSSFQKERLEDRLEDVQEQIKRKDPNEHSQVLQLQELRLEEQSLLKKIRSD